MQRQDDDRWGDADPAAARLYWLSRAFDPGTLTYVRKAVRRPPRCCIDLGAGPGFLARSLHRALECSRTLGLEISPRFIARGQRALPPGLELVRHDVTSPLPVSGDLVVSRFVLGHVRDPLAALCTWRESEPLLLVLEELVQAAADLPVLRGFHDLVAVVQRAAGLDIYVGARLEALAQSAGFVIESQCVERLALPVSIVARMHALSLPSLRRRAAVRAYVSERELDVLQRALDELAAETASGFVQVDVARCRAVLA